MEGKGELLEQLRIDRNVQTRVGSSRIHWRWWTGATIAVLLIAFGTWLKIVDSKEMQIQTSVAVAVQTNGTVSSGSGSLLDASGYVVALRQASVAAKSIYKVDEVLVQAGDTVKRNQVIARLDATNVRAALAQSIMSVNQFSAVLAAAKVAVTDARPAFLRDQTQLNERLISQDAFDTVRANYDADVAAVQVAEGNLAVARANVEVNRRFEDDTIIRAPFDGVVTVKSAQPGQIVSPQFSGGGGIAQIVDMDSLEVDVDVSENFISRVHPNQPATIMLNAYPDWHIRAQVIATVPTADRSKATVEVRVGLKQKDPRILPEMGARVSFLAEDLPGVGSQKSDASISAVSVPVDGVLGTDAAGFVFVVDGDVVRRRPVRLGTQRNGVQIILSGLEPGAKVAVGDLQGLQDGTKVRLSQ